jgi:hypothetical protein
MSTWSLAAVGGMTVRFGILWRGGPTMRIAYYVPDATNAQPGVGGGPVMVHNLVRCLAGHGHASHLVAFSVAHWPDLLARWWEACQRIASEWWRRVASPARAT